MDEVSFVKEPAQGSEEGINNINKMNSERWKVHRKYLSCLKLQDLFRLSVYRTPSLFIGFSG